MKKRIIPFVAAIIAMIIMLSGCSCTGKALLVFDNGFNGGNNAPTQYKETLTYKVEYIESYANNFTKSSDIPDDVLKMDVVDGTYTMTLEIFDSAYAKGVEELKDTDIFDKYSDIKEVYKLTTNLSLTSVYTCYTGFDDEDSDEHRPEGEKGLWEPEYITTTTYFLSRDFSFNPIYSRTDGYTSFAAIQPDGIVQIAYSNYFSETKYNAENYTTEMKYGDMDKEIKNCDYTFKTLIDNNLLLFALRNISITKEQEYGMPTVHPTYGEAQTLAITNVDEREQKFSVNEHKEENFKVSEYAVVRNVQNATGSPQFFIVQKDKTTNFADRALLLKYVAPLSLYGSYLCLGGLSYTLVSVS